MDESWGDPENFRPERFIDESGNIITPPTYLPFGFGKYFNIKRRNHFLFFFFNNHMFNTVIYLQ